MCSPNPSLVRAISFWSKRPLAEGSVRNRQLERFNSAFEFLQLFPAPIEKRDCNAVSIARAWRHRYRNESEVRRRTTLDVYPQIVRTSNQPPGRKNAGTKLGRKFCDVRRSSNQLHLAQLAQESNSLDIGLFTLDLCHNVQPSDSSRCHRYEVLCSGSSVCLRIAISAVSHPYCNADGANCSDCLNPSGYGWLRCKFNHCLQPKNNMENREKSGSCNQGEKHPVRDFERLGSHKRPDREKYGRPMIFKRLFRYRAEAWG